jgi:hypothetical protein
MRMTATPLAVHRLLAQVADKSHSLHLLREALLEAVQPLGAQYLHRFLRGAGTKQPGPRPRGRQRRGPFCRRLLALRPG